MKIPARIGVFERIVQNVTVTVVVLANVRRLYIGVGTEKAAQFGVVDPAVHVDQAHFLHVFVTGVAPVGEGGQGVAGVGGGAPVAATALAEGFVAHAFDGVWCLCRGCNNSIDAVYELITPYCAIALQGGTDYSRNVQPLEN